MNIGDAAKRAALPAKTIRYYEDIGLVTPSRDSNGYRSFNDRDVHILVFIGRARALGFSIEDCRNLLKLWEDDGRASADVRQIARQHLDHIEAKIADLQSMRDTLEELVQACAGDHRPNCPILRTLEGAE
jgi:MerR family transcriptional regulator, copper efflux regulator